MIAVNAAIEWLPRVDAFFSLDPDRRIYGLASRPRPGVQYFLAVPDDFGRPDAQCVDHRRPRLAHVTHFRRTVGAGPFGSCAGLSDDPGAIHTGNSAFGALGLAKHLGGQKVAMFGVDGTRQRVSGGRSRNLAHLPWLFSTVDEPGMSIVNGSPASMVDCFPRMEQSAALEWLKS